MKDWLKRLIVVGVIACSSVVFVACEQNEGVGEQMGEQIDEAAEETKDAAEEVGDEIEDATDE